MIYFYILLGLFLIYFIVDLVIKANTILFDYSIRRQFPKISEEERERIFKNELHLKINIVFIIGILYFLINNVQL